MTVIVLIVILVIFVMWLLSDKNQIINIQYPTKEVQEEQEEEIGDWNEYLLDTEIDPEIALSHADYMTDANTYRRASSYTSVSSGDSNADAYVNYVGLRRPQHVEIGPGARTVPDIDESVLKKN